MKKLLLLAGLLAGPAWADQAVPIWGLGLDACPALVKASDDNLERYQSKHKGGGTEDANFAGDVMPYFQYLSGVLQGYEQGGRQVLTSGFNSLFFGAVDYCRKNPADKVAQAVADTLSKAKFEDLKPGK
jgi:hypothetical protein